jgi:hypothetical protein
LIEQLPCQGLLDHDRRGLTQCRARHHEGS